MKNNRIAAGLSATLIISFLAGTWVPLANMSPEVLDMIRESVLAAVETPYEVTPSSYDEQPALIPECFSLMNELSERYRVPKAVCLRLFLPAEMRAGRVHEVYKKLVKPPTDNPPEMTVSAPVSPTAA